MGRAVTSWLSGAKAAAVLGAVSACDSSRITASKVEGALAPTFANLISLESKMMDLPPVDAAAFRASATCHRVSPGNPARGAGTWQCEVVWFLPGRRGSLHDGYELSVTTDGCYTATVDGAEGHLGGPTITTRSGETLVNLLYAFDGCFDTT